MFRITRSRARCCPAIRPGSSCASWIDAAAAVSGARRARFGFLGHNYPGMLDMYSDFTQISAQVARLSRSSEIDDLVARVESATPAEIASKGAEIRAAFELAVPGTDPIAGKIEPERFDWLARVAAGLDALVRDFALDGLTYYYRGLGDNVNERVGAALIVGNSLLTARGIPTAGEGDLKTNVAMLLLDRLGAGGSYTEFYALDFDEEFVLMGHDGPGHVAIADGRPVLRALKLFHGKAGGRALGGDEGAPRAGHDPRPLADRRRAAEAAGRRGRVDRRARLSAWATPTRASVSLAARPPSWRPGAPRARRTTSRWASGTARTTSAVSPPCSASSWRSSNERPAVYAAIDLGAESGRVLCGRLSDGRVELAEANRFPNRPVRLPDGLHWNLLSLFSAALDGLRAAAPSTRCAASASMPGASTTRCWTSAGACSACPSTTATSAPWAWSSARTPASRAIRCTARPASRRSRSTPSSSCWPRSGGALAAASRIALVPDLLTSWLSGVVANEATAASTTGLLDARSGRWAT